MDTTVMLPFGATINNREAQWATKRDALSVAKALGLPATSARRVERLGFLVWVLTDSDLNTLTHAQIGR